MSAERASRVSSLDGLRALSITMVVLCHMRVPQPHNPIAAACVAAARNGPLGVTVFFVISGFIITRLLTQEHAGTGRINLVSFYMRRALRILPAFYVYIAVLLALGAAGVLTLDYRCLLSSLCFLRNYATPIEHYPDWVTAHFWSLAVEEQFYLFWPCILAFWGMRNASRTAIGLIAAAPVLRVLSYYWLPTVRNEFSYFTHTRIDAPMFGCLAALAFDRPALQRLLDRRAWLPLTCVLFAAFISPQLRSHYGGWYTLPIGETLENGAITCALLWCVRKPITPAGRLLNARPVVYVGLISYSLYLWQELFLRTHRDVWVLGAIAAAVCSYHLVERPILSLRRRLDRSAIGRVDERRMISVESAPDIQSG